MALDHGRSLFDVVFTPDGKWLATGPNKAVSDEPEVPVSIWDAQSGELLLEVPTPSLERTYEVEFSRDGQKLITAGEDGLVKVWEIAALLEGGQEAADMAQPIVTMRGHTDGATLIDLAPSSEMLVSSSYDETARIWDIDSGEELLRLPAGSWATELSPDGKYLATGMLDGTLRDYVLDMDELLALARSRLTRTFTPLECQQFRIESCQAQAAPVTE